MKWLLFLATVSSAACQELYRSYNLSSIESSGAEFCPCTEKLREKIKQDVDLFINNSVVPALRGRGACGCGGHGWRRAAYLNMSDPTQTSVYTTLDSRSVVGMPREILNSAVYFARAL